MRLPIYLDYLATTPVDPRVAAAMAGCLSLEGYFANPASRSHRYGWEAEMQVENARRDVADLIGADPREIVWTSGATEADNLALKGALASAGKGAHLITARTEHKAVLDPCAWLESQGVEVSYLEPGADGVISAAAVASALRPHTRLVSIMHANNEIGTLNPVAEIGALCRQAGVLLHVDAAQSAGKLPIDVSAMQVDLLALSAHKFYGPKGVGALYVRRAIAGRVQAQMHGGGHERGLRAGTLPTHQLVGMGTAARLAAEAQAGEALRLHALRERLWAQLAALGGVGLNGDAERRLPGALNVHVEGVDGEVLLHSLKDIAISTGSACTSASVEPSHVLRAIGLPRALALCSLRISLGRFTTEQEVAHAGAHLSEVISRLRGAA